MRHCEHVKANGEFCGTPALRGRDYCHWHITCIARRLQAEKQAGAADPEPLSLPPLEDANSIQVAVMMVLDALLRGRITRKASGLVLYGLQIASGNLKQGVCFHPAQNDDADGQPTRSNSYDSLEQDYGIAEHAEQLHVAHEDDGFDETEEEQQQQEQLSEVEQFLRDSRSYLPKGYVFIGDTSDLQEMEEWRHRKQLQTEQRRQHWESIRRDLAEAAGSEDVEHLKEMVAGCYDRAGLHYEGEEWKPGGPQMVLFGVRKLPQRAPRQSSRPSELDKTEAQSAAG